MEGFQAMPPRSTATQSISASRPLIGINSEYLTLKNSTSYIKLNADYCDAILAAGGIPIIIPPFRKENFAETEAVLDMVSGVILSGGLDLDPKKYGQQTTNAVQMMDPRREESDRFLLNKIVERKLPLLGIGVGMQLINVYFGGSLFLHLPAENAKVMPHFDPSGAGPHRHMVIVEPKSTLEDIYGTPELRVNSMHHQGVNVLGKKLRIGARAPDGIIEAIETTDDSWFCIGMQWHPECNTASALDCQIFDCLIQSATKYQHSMEMATA